MGSCSQCDNGIAAGPLLYMSICIKRGRERERESERERERDRDREIEREKNTKSGSERATEKNKEREREKESETESERERERERKRERAREREKEREGESRRRDMERRRAADGVPQKVYVYAALYACTCVTYVYVCTRHFCIVGAIGRYCRSSEKQKKPLSSFVRSQNLNDFLPSANVTREKPEHLLISCCFGKQVGSPHHIIRRTLRMSSFSRFIPPARISVSCGANQKKLQTE